MEKNKETKEIQPITKELLDSLTGWERAEAMEKYLEWQQKERKLQRKLAKRDDRRLYQFQHREQINEYQREYYKTHKWKFRERYLRYQANKKKKLKNARNKGV